MSVVTVRLVEGLSARYTETGWEVTEVAMVSGLVGTPAARIYAAVQAVIGVVGAISVTEHPEIAGAFLREFNPEASSSEEVRVTVVWKTSSANLPLSVSIMEVGTSAAQEVESNTDIDGVPIILGYTYPANYATDPLKRGVRINQGGMIHKFPQESTKIVTRRELADPFPKSEIYAGTVNSGAWTLDPTALPRQWKCDSITGRSEDGGITFTVVYTFTKRRDTWDETVCFINPDDGKPPPDLIFYDYGKQVVRRAVETNFNGLGLP